MVLAMQSQIENNETIQMLIEKFGGMTDEEGRTAYCYSKLSGNDKLSDLLEFEKEIEDIYGKKQDLIV
jgi:hypothetical protein